MLSLQVLANISSKFAAHCYQPYSQQSVQRKASRHRRSTLTQTIWCHLISVRSRSKRIAAQSRLSHFEHKQWYKTMQKALTSAFVRNLEIEGVNPVHLLALSVTNDLPIISKTSSTSLLGIFLNKFGNTIHETFKSEHLK